MVCRSDSGSAQGWTGRFVAIDRASGFKTSFAYKAVAGGDMTQMAISCIAEILEVVREPSSRLGSQV